MFRSIIPIQNLKCANCATELKRKVLQLKNISSVFIYNDYSYVSFNHKSMNDLSNVENLLTLLGFPPVGEKTKNWSGSYCSSQSKDYCIFSNSNTSIPNTGHSLSL